MEEEKIIKKLETKRILIYLGLTFALTYLLEIGVITRLIKSGDGNQMSVAQMLMGTVMFIPAICVILTRVITKEGFQNMCIRPYKPWKQLLKYYIFAWVGMALFTVIGSVIYFAVNPGNFDPDMGYMLKVLKSAGNDITLDMLKKTMVSQILIGVLLAPVMNFFNCFGEELGWRGYLFPKMKKKMKLVPMLLVTGVMWGLWHAPLTALGHNYGTGYKGQPVTGILAMCVFCIVFGTIFSYLTYKTHSCIPAVLAHGSLNGFAAIGVYFTRDGGNPFVGPAPTGIIGGIGFVVLAVIMAVLMAKDGGNKHV